MSELIIEVTEASFDQDVLAAGGPVLLDLWAPWCAPCRALAPVLKKLSVEFQGGLQIAKIDVEKYPEIQRRFGVRGIPTMILFRNGVEAARATGTKSAEDMRRWLASEGVQVPANAPAQTMPSRDAPVWGAFYGDVELRDFLVGRLRARAAAGCVKYSRMPFWADGSGTISAALAGSGDARVFEGVTGIPSSFAYVLEFCVEHDLSAEDVDAVMKDIPPGANLHTVAPQMMLAFFDGNIGDWKAILADAALDALRERWISLVIRTLAGKDVERNEWDVLTTELESLLSTDSAPERQVQDEFINGLTSLSPLPDPDDSESWGRGILMSGSYLSFVLAASAMGWRSEDFALERFRHNWFVEREEKEPGGEFGEEALSLARDEWLRQHGERQRSYHAFFENREEHMASVSAKIRACLTNLLTNVPIISAE